MIGHSRKAVEELFTSRAHEVGFYVEVVGKISDVSFLVDGGAELVKLTGERFIDTSQLGYYGRIKAAGEEEAYGDIGAESKADGILEQFNESINSQTFV